MDLRFGRPLAGEVSTRFAHLGAKDTANSDYLALDRIFEGRIAPDDVLVDVGCGKGRVINWWLRNGYRNAIVGLELDPVIAARTRARLRSFPTVTIRAGDALQTLPSEGTLFYLFNPFDADVVERFADRLAQLGRERGGPIRLLYNNCKYLAPFVESGDWQVQLLNPQLTDPFDRVADIVFVSSLTR